MWLIDDNPKLLSLKNYPPEKFSNCAATVWGFGVPALGLSCPVFLFRFNMETYWGGDSLKIPLIHTTEILCYKYFGLYSIMFLFSGCSSWDWLNWDQTIVDFGPVPSLYLRSSLAPHTTHKLCLCLKNILTLISPRPISILDTQNCGKFTSVYGNVHVKIPRRTKCEKNSHLSMGLCVGKFLEIENICESFVWYVANA
jgi:hypothetical protein